MPTIKILVVEDETLIRRLYRHLAEETFAEKNLEIIEAETPEEAHQQLAAYPDIALIVMDGKLGKILTIPLVKEIKQKFSGPMIAASGEPQLMKELVAAGCQHSFPKGIAVIQGVIAILQL